MPDALWVVEADKNLTHQKIFRRRGKRLASRNFLASLQQTTEPLLL
jgi:hypothetical protein